MKKRSKILIVGRSPGIRYDDRIRKIGILLSKYYEVKLVMNRLDNSTETYTDESGLREDAIPLKTTEWLPSGRFLIFKVLEFYWRIRRDILDSDFVWAHEESTFLIPLLAAKSTVIWDLHELPFFFRDGLSATVFRYLERRTKFMVHANEWRIKYLKNKGLLKADDKQKSIRNFPDDRFLECELVYGDLQTLRDRALTSGFAYLQGISSEGRYPYQSVSAILKNTGKDVVIVGGLNKGAENRLRNEFGDEFSRRVVNLGMVDQLEIGSIVRLAAFSIVLYNIDIPNNRYCEPNRLYQALALGVPVIAGCNEPMKETLEGWGTGLVLSDDGRNEKELGEAVAEMDRNIELYRRDLELLRDNFRWESMIRQHSWIAAI